VIVLIGLGLGYALDALEQRQSQASVIAIEPFADVMPHFYTRRDWSAWVSTGRLQIVCGPSYSEGPLAWETLEPSNEAPVLVAPTLAIGWSAVVAACRAAWMRAKRGTRMDPFLAPVKQSMLHPAVLTTLEHFAASARGPIVEIGAYVGGATIALARGVRDSGRDTPIVTIEPGGTYPHHPDLPSIDIFRDLERNLRARRLDRFVILHEGLSSDRAAVELVTSVLAKHDARIGMLCIDADGEVQRDFDLYLPVCGDGCLLAVDDYSSVAPNEKTAPTQAAVDRLLAEGRAHPLGVHGYGTWMGVYRPHGD
jgi:predicted O-methyltransferase YrrM